MRQKSIKNVRQEFKDKGIFYTPKALAERLKTYVDIEPKNVYDPTCGAGSLLSVWGDNIKKYGQELDKEQLELVRLPNFTGYAGDTLMDDGFKGKKFECIVANPPFSVKYNPATLAEDERFQKCPALPPPSKADWAFILHILHHLDDKGVAVILEFPGILYRGQKEGIVRRWFVEENYIDRVVEIPGNTFEDTTIGTCIIVLKKNRNVTNITFERGERTIVVPYSEIKENGFILSPSTYLPDEIEKEKIDPIELDKGARKSFLIRLKRELDFEKMVCKMEGISIAPFLDAIKLIVKSYYD
jgi:type I restriction system adenine methylase HsdM